MTLSITNPSAVTQVSGTAYPDTIMGNGVGDTLIGNGGDDYLDGRGGGALIEGSETQVVYLNFLPGAVDYTSQTTRDAIEARIAAIYGDFNYTFTQTVPASGPFAEIDFNVPAGTYLGGEATGLDWRNLDLGGSATVDISQFLQFPGLVGVAGLPAATTRKHHQHVGDHRRARARPPLRPAPRRRLRPDRHRASRRRSSTTRTSTASIPRTAARRAPRRPPYHVMGSPASVGTSLYDATRVTFFGERDAIKLAFADSGTTVLEATGTNNSRRDGPAA